MEVGQRVETGQLLGYVGNTGFSGEPHIHIMVYVYRWVGRFENQWQSLPIRFKDKNGNPFIPKCSEYYSNYSLVFLCYLIFGFVCVCCDMCCVVCCCFCLLEKK